MGDTTTVGGGRDIGVSAATATAVGSDAEASDVVEIDPPDQVPTPEPGVVVGRSPGQLAWMRIKRDRVAVVSAVIVVIFGVVALLAPVIQWLYGQSAEMQNSRLLDDFGQPLGVLGGVSGDHWLGVTPGAGYDLFLQLIFGARTSLVIAVISSIIGVGLGSLIGVVAGYLGGWADRTVVWLSDLFLAFPFFLFTIALVPAISTHLEDQYGEIAVWKRVAVLIAIFIVFGWMGTARLVRGNVVSLREREYVEAARAAGARTSHIIFRQILPNTWAPILVSFSLSVPLTVTAEAALSFLGIGIVEPTPDLGRLIYEGVRGMSNTGYAPLFVILPGLVIFTLVLAFNLLGDALRDALDPKSSR